MKRFQTILPLMLLIAAVTILPAGALAEEEDDSVIVPVEISEEISLDGETAESRSLAYGDDGDDVLALQTRLTELGYYSGNLSGRYREGTRAAVKAFQADFGMEETGEADAMTLSLIYSTLYRPLRYGSKGEDVKELQTRLMELGYYQGKISGNYLEGTRAGIRAFQEKAGLDVTGVADVETQEALFAPNAPGKNDSIPGEATATPAPGESHFLVDDGDTAAENGVTLADEPIPFTKQLKSGSTGKLVKQLQERITELGYYTGPISGNYLKNTVRAVKTIQTQNGLEATGVVDETTWNVIFNDGKIVLPGNTPRPTPSPTPVPFAITVDVENQVTTVYGRDEEGNYTVVVRQMLCSTGTKDYPSDVGDWVLSGRHATWCVFPKWGGSKARYWTKINSSIAFHSVIYTAYDVAAVKVSSYEKLGQRASHGCIRLTVADAKWIYDNIGKGTVVSIVEGMKKDPELRDALKLPAYDYQLHGPSVTPVPTAEPVYDSSVKPELAKTLKKNAQSETVYWAQMRLTELGYYTGKCSGKILGGTMDALKAFQTDHGLKSDGTLTAATLDALYEAATPTPAPTATPTPGPEETDAGVENG